MATVTFAQARQGFKFANQTENKSPKTVQWYDYNLGLFGDWLASKNGGPEGTEVRAIGGDTIREFIAYLQNRKTVNEDHPSKRPEARGLSAHSIRGTYATLSAFFHWVKEEEMVSRNPMEHLHRPKIPSVIKDRFSEEEVKKILDACDYWPEHIAARNHAIVLFLLDTGVRAAELCTLTLDRLDLEHGRAHVIGKGMKERFVFLGKATRKSLWSYLHLHRPEGSSAMNVFLSRNGDPMTPTRLARLLRDLGKHAGVAHCHPHRFRHTAARLFLRNGGDAFALQRMLGHEGLETTRRYVELEREDLEKAHERCSPVDRWGLK